MAKGVREILDTKLKAGTITESLYKEALAKFAELDENLDVAVGKYYRGKFGEDEALQNYIAYSKRHGFWYTDQQELTRAGEDLDKILQSASDADGKDYHSLAARLDSPDDADLHATFILNIPSVRSQVLQAIGSYDKLYRVSSHILKERKKNKKKYKAEKEVQEDLVDPTELYKDLVRELPEYHFEALAGDDKVESTPKEGSEQEDKQRLYLILREKARRDAFRFFKTEKDLDKAFSDLEQLVDDEKDSNLRFIYEDQRNIFQKYVEFQEEVKSKGFVNEEFEHPATGEKDVISSFHQIVAMYENIKDKRFGVWDDCGTGKTAIAALLSPLVREEREKEGKPVFGRTLIIGPKTSTKAWKDGLEGELAKRYFTDKQKVAWLNGKKDTDFLVEMAQAEVVFANYEQLGLDFTIGGEKKKVFEVLMDIGYDHLIVDEVQDAKNDRNTTKKGNVTESLAVRVLGTRPGLDHITLLSGTPMPDNIEDYANLLFLLRPEYFMEDGELKFDDIKKRFKEIYEGDPRLLYTLVKQNTIRRTSEEVSDLPGCTVIEPEIALSDAQEKIVDYIFETGKSDWLPQIRRAVLDPRLVSPKVLDELGLSGELRYEDSPKYQKLEEILADPEGPLQNGEKVVIFSSMFAEGVTRDAKALEKKYKKAGKLRDFRKMAVKDLRSELESHLSEKLGRPVTFEIIDGETKHEDRESSVDRLNNGLDGIICTTEAGGVSLNFSAATTGIFLDKHYSPASVHQAVKRIVRRGQKGKAKIYFLDAQDSVDMDVNDVIENKRENIRMALDGIELLDKEKAVLTKREDERIRDLILKRKSGMAIDLSAQELEDLDSFGAVRVAKRKKGKAPTLTESHDRYEPTIAQEIRKVIANDPVNCWHDDAFVQKYIESFHLLGPYVLARAKVANFVAQAEEGKIDFPERLLADASGQGILYSAFQDLESLVEGHGLALPHIVDRDFSRKMHEASPNPDKFLADITGKPRVFDARYLKKHGSFDLVDCSSVTLLPNREKIRDYLLEANRVLREGGTLQLGVGAYHFSPEFLKGMEEAGFEKKTQLLKHKVNPSFIKVLKKAQGQRYAEAYAGKLQNSHFMIFEKAEDVKKLESKHFLLEHPDAPEEQAVEEKKKTIVRKKIPSADGTPRRVSKKRDSKKKYTGKKRLIRNPDGTIMEAQ